MSILEANRAIAVEAAAAAYHAVLYGSPWMDLSIEKRHERIHAMQVALQHFEVRGSRDLWTRCPNCEALHGAGDLGPLSAFVVRGSRDTPPYPGGGEIEPVGSEPT